MTDTLLPTGIDRLLAIMAALRDRDTGCPWDIEQTFATIAPYTLEEAHEVADAIDRAAAGSDQPDSTVASWSRRRGRCAAGLAWCRL